MASRVYCLDAHSDHAGNASFREQFCLRFLREAQNPDGGWGYRPGNHSATDPTCWALLALASSERVELDQTSRGIQWLLRVQLPDGSWPAVAGQSQGCWVTPLGCLALQQHGAAPDAVGKGVSWLKHSWPGEGRFWQRLRMRLFASSSLVRQNHSLRGWSWTPGTSSWVEPTAYALILLRNLFPNSAPPSLARRQQLAEAMLYDRMCPGGGWNSGNPFVYGVAGEPLVGPTVWALLALQHRRDRAENQKSLEWLERASKQDRKSVV